MGRFRIARNINKEEKQLLQAKLDSSLVEDVNLLCKWSGNEKNYVIAELLRYALSQETEFQTYKGSLRRGSASESMGSTETNQQKREPASERKTQPSAVAR